MKPIALITGTSSGLGLHTAVLLAQNGFTVYATMRNLNKKEALLEAAKSAGTTVQLLQLDVTDDASVSNCISRIIAQEGRIDLLINNAGAGFAKTTEDTTLEEMEQVLDTNFKSVVRCTKAVLPQMRMQKSGHIVNITSVGGLVGQPFNEFYCAAKFAVEGYTESLATYLTPGFGIRFTLVEPGGITSEFLKSAMTATTAGGPVSEAYAPLWNAYVASAQRRAAAGKEQTYQSGSQVAEVVLAVVKMENPPLRIRTSGWAEDFCRLKTEADPDGLLLRAKLEERFFSEGGKPLFSSSPEKGLTQEAL